MILPCASERWSQGQGDLLCQPGQSESVLAPDHPSHSQLYSSISPLQVPQSPADLLVSLQSPDDSLTIPFTLLAVTLLISLCLGAETTGLRPEGFFSKLSKASHTLLELTSSSSFCPPPSLVTGSYEQSSYIRSQLCIGFPWKRQPSYTQ